MKIKVSRAKVLLASGGAVLLGISLHAAVSQVIGMGTIAHLEQFGGPATIMMRTLTIAPEEVLGWHQHPGIGAYTIVTQGTLVVEDGCGVEQTYTQGQAFLEAPNRVHRGKNLSSTETVITAQTFVVPEGSPTSVTTTQLCGAPITVDECRHIGWMQFTNPRTFVSQGDCQQFVITGK